MSTDLAGEFVRLEALGVAEHVGGGDDLVRREGAEVQMHAPVPVDRDRAAADADARMAIDLDRLRADRMARDFQREARPRLAGGAHHQRHAADDAVAVGPAVDQPMPERDIVKLGNGGELGRPAVDRRRQLAA